jgi:ribosomal protein L40E
MAFYVEWRDAESKICPRCAERVKAAALVCRHCSQAFEKGLTDGGRA